MNGILPFFFAPLLSLHFFHNVLISISFYIKREFLVNVKTLLTLLVPNGPRVRQLHRCSLQQNGGDGLRRLERVFLVAIVLVKR